MMDVILEAWVSVLIETTKLGWMLREGKRWKPGEKLRLLFTGYNGTRNTGSDVRVEEILRQVRQILGDEQTQLSVLSQNFSLTREYFQGTAQVKLPDIFPPFLYREVCKYDGVVACEGSMFKSKFANALTTMIIGSLGLASAQNKLSVGYGAEAGEMDALLMRMCSRYCRQSMIITRNLESMSILSGLGVPADLGTDTAWTFEPLGPEYGRKVLRAAGWDGKTDVLVVCPINPYWWPVKPSVVKYLWRTIGGAYKESHYRSVYFHNTGPRVRAAHLRYVTALANAVDRFRKSTPVFPVLVAMERLDTRACLEMSNKLGGLPIFTSDDYTMYQLVSILRSCHLMVSSRYHGVVTSMPALVASAGVTMDERIRNLMHERGHDDLLAEADDPDLEEKLGDILVRLQEDREAIRDAIGRTVARNLKLMARMGACFEQQVQRCYPDFPVRSGLVSWENYLPPLGANLRKLAEEYT